VQREIDTPKQGITKKCCVSWLTNCALVYATNAGGGRGVAGSEPMSTASQINFGDPTPFYQMLQRVIYCTVAWGDIGWALPDFKTGLVWLSSRDAFRGKWVGLVVLVTYIP
jgi:hypothetical protein